MELSNKTENQPKFVEEIIAEKPVTIDKVFEEMERVDQPQEDLTKPKTKRIRIAIAKRKE